MNGSDDAEQTTVILLLPSHSSCTDSFTNSSAQCVHTQGDNNGFSQTLSLVLQASAAVVGFIGNVITYVVLTRSTSISSGTSLRLLKNQAVVDGVVCFVGSMFVLQPSMWKTGINETLDLLVCQV